jgi:predicted TIM-barrel fold metal-dependent hydrolase
MLVDLHTHVNAPEHLIGTKFMEDCIRGGGSYGGMICGRERHFSEEMAQADIACIMALDAPASGLVVPNEYCAAYQRDFPDRIVGFASVDPNRPDAADGLKHAIMELGLKGLKLGPIYQHFHPLDEKRAYPVYEMALKLGIPVMWHMGTSFVEKGPLEYTRPIHIDRVALDFPDLRQVIAHLGHPWEADTIVLIRKQPNVYADISALYYRPWQFYNSMVLAMEYKVTHKLFFGTDYPVTTPQSTIDGCMAVRRFGEGTGLPEIPKSVFDGIIGRNPLEILGIRMG